MKMKNIAMQIQDEIIDCLDSKMNFNDMVKAVSKKLDVPEDWVESQFEVMTQA